MKLREAPLRMTTSISNNRLGSSHVQSLRLKPRRYALEWATRHAGCQLAAYAFEVSVELLRTGQGGLNVGQNIFRSDVVEEAGA